jgi:hypothetical protein
VDLFQDGDEAIVKGRGQRLAGELPCELDGHLVRFQIGETGGAQAQMLFDEFAVFGGEFTSNKIDEQLNEFTTGYHADTSSK